MAFSTANFTTAGPLGSIERGTAQAANAFGVYAQSQITTTGGVATATTTSKVKTVSTVSYRVKGALQTDLSATDNFWTLSGTTVAASSWQKYLLLVDTAGAASIQEATQSIVSAAAVTWTNVSGVSPWAPFLTAVGDTKCIVGVLTVATDATHTFVPGTTLLGAAGITATFVNGIDQSILPLIGNASGTILGLT